MKCSHFQIELPNGSKFCKECGHSLVSPEHGRPPKDLSFDEKLAKIRKYHSPKKAETRRLNGYSLREAPGKRYERGTSMRTYVVLCNWTQKGIEHVKESPARLDEVKKAFQAMGAEIKAFYLVMGRYDMVIVAEAPDDETVAKLALAVGSRGGTRTETLRAYPEDEYLKIIAALP